ncbi:MAG: hypothetical protein Q4A68_02955 [Anaerobiospirillum succiniciproducens]|uniref:hypothetical protein n=1 Tax=Anaerobiospirillum succiniciproducens TaxID=13335 RepID=UPI0026DAD7C2|nr:hypothetical protein [Anaerobiospirillum succiniciproducens]MDO4675527.1 hypothetical protein [Anaerobiospirillum succiniciproducens]
MNAYSIASNFRTETLDFAWINNLKLYIIRLQKVGSQIKMDPVFIGTAALQKTTVLAAKGRRETFLICWFLCN